MTTRVIGIPDADGVIRIACGGDVVEIVVAPKPSPQAQGPVPDPFGDPFAALVAEIADSAVDLPGAYLAAPVTPSGEVDLPALVDSRGRQRADPGRPDPRAVILQVGEIDLHRIAALGEAMAREAPDLPLVIDFGSGRPE